MLCIFTAKEKHLTFPPQVEGTLKTTTVNSVAVEHKLLITAG